MEVIYQAASETIRQMPENYLLAHKRNGAWVCEPDLAANRNIAVRIFKALFNYDVKYGTGENIIAKI